MGDREYVRDEVGKFAPVGSPTHIPHDHVKIVQEANKRQNESMLLRWRNPQEVMKEEVRTKVQDFIKANPTASTLDYFNQIGMGETDSEFKKSWFGGGSNEASNAGKILFGKASREEIDAAKQKFGNNFENYLQHQYAFTQAKLGDRKTLSLYRGLHEKDSGDQSSLVSYTSSKEVAEGFAEQGYSMDSVVLHKKIPAREVLMHWKFEAHWRQSEAEVAVING